MLPLDLTNRSHQKSYGLAFFAMAFVLLLPMFTFTMPLGMQLWVMKCYQLLCHQIADRSFHVDHVPFAVCHRCTGIYLGILGATCLFPFTSKSDQKWMERAKWYIIAASLPVLLDVGLEWIQVQQNTWYSRFLTGFLLGLVAGYYAIRGISHLIWELIKTSKPFKLHKKNEKY